MSEFGNLLRKLRKEKGLSIDELVTKLNNNYDSKISKSMISRYENGQADPKMENVRIFADFFDVKLDEILGLEKNVEVIDWNNKLPELNDKDERNIQKELQKMIDGLSSNSGYAAFDGATLEEMDEEDRELLLASLENSLKIAKRIAKQKYTPKKYRK